MSKNALLELLQAPVERFHIWIKNTPDSEKPEILNFLKYRLSLLENLS